MLRSLFAAGRKVAPGAGRSVVASHSALNRAPHGPSAQVYASFHRVSSARLPIYASPFSREPTGLGLFESDIGKRLVGEINTNFYHFNHIANNIPQNLKRKYPPRTLLDPLDKALLRAALDSGMLGSLLRYNESGMPGSLYIAALTMENGGRLPGPWRDYLQGFLINHASLLEVQGLNPMAHQQLLKAFFYYPNDGTYWDFSFDRSSTSPDLAAKYQNRETAVNYRMKMASLPGGPAQMDPSTLPKNFPVLRDEIGTWDVKLRKPGKSDSTKEYRVRVLKSDNLDVPKRYFYRVDWGPGPEQYILKTMPWDHQPQGELVQRIGSRLTPKRGWKFLDFGAQEQFDRFREHHKKLHKEFVFPGFEAMYTEAEKEWLQKGRTGNEQYNSNLSDGPVMDGLT